ncbi:MAG: choice-of-anchor Q domain-containing protein [Pseudomonadota bacterium]
MRDGRGAAILNLGFAVLDNVTTADNYSFSADRSPSSNDAIYNRGRMSIRNSRFLRDGITNNGRLTITGSEFRGAQLRLYGNAGALDPVGTSTGRQLDATYVANTNFIDQSSVYVGSDAIFRRVQVMDNPAGSDPFLNRLPPDDERNPSATGWGPNARDAITISIEQSSIVRNTFRGTPFNVLSDATGSVELFVTDTTIAEYYGQHPAIGCDSPNATVTMNGVTIVGETRERRPKGIRATNACRMNISNTLIATPTNTACALDDSAIINIRNSFATDDSCGAPAIDDPMLSRLAYNGGDTLNMLPSADSPLVNAGVPGRPQLSRDRRCDIDEDQAEAEGIDCDPEQRERDQRGEPRIARGRRDIGAVEVQ